MPLFEFLVITVVHLVAGPDLSPLRVNSDLTGSDGVSALIRVFEMDTVGQTDVVGTRRYQPIVNSVMTEVALLGYVSIRVKGDGVIGTCLYTRPASSTFLIVHHHNTVISFDNCLIRARINTRRLITVSTHTNVKGKIQSAVNHLGTVFQDRNQIDPISSVVFLFAGHLAGLTSPAGLPIYE